MPVRPRSVNSARPSAASTVAEPTSEPPDVDTVMRAVLDVARLPAASRTSTTGCVSNAAPEGAPSPSVTRRRLAAAPLAGVIVCETTGRSVAV